MQMVRKMQLQVESTIVLVNATHVISACNNLVNVSKVLDEEANKTYYFGCGKWFGQGIEEGLLERTLAASDKDPRGAFTEYKVCSLACPIKHAQTPCVLPWSMRRPPSISCASCTAISIAGVARLAVLGVTFFIIAKRPTAQNLFIHKKDVLNWGILFLRWISTPAACGALAQTQLYTSSCMGMWVTAKCSVWWLPRRRLSVAV